MALQKKEEVEEVHYEKESCRKKSEEGREGREEQEKIQKEIKRRKGQGGREREGRRYMEVCPNFSPPHRCQTNICGQNLVAVIYSLMINTVLGN